MDEKFKKLHTLTESFIKEADNLTIEGYSDVAKAKFAGLKGGIQGFGKQIAGNFKKGIGNLANKGISTVAKGLGGDPKKSPWAKSTLDFAKRGQAQIDTGKNQAYTDKYNTYVQSSVDSLVNDLKTLNINVANKNKLVNDITTAIKGNTQQPAGVQQPVASVQNPQAKQSAVMKPVQTATGINPAQTTPIKPVQTAAGINPAQTATKQTGKKYAGQWLSPTKKVSMLGQGEIDVDPNDASQVENPFSPKYNQKTTNVRQANAQKSFDSNPTASLAEPIESPIQQQIASVNKNKLVGKQNSRAKVKAQMGLKK